MTEDRIKTLQHIFTHGKRGEVISAGNELIAALAAAMARQPKPKRARQASMFAPTLEEVQAFAKEIGLNSGEPEAFFDHYEAQGWKRGRSGTIPIRNFKAAMRTWKRNHEKFKAEKKVPGAGTIGSKYNVG